MFKDPACCVSKTRTPLPLRWPDQRRQLGGRFYQCTATENRDLACSARCVLCRRQNMPTGRARERQQLRSSISKGYTTVLSCSAP